MSDKEAITSYEFVWNLCVTHGVYWNECIYWDDSFHRRAFRQRSFYTQKLLHIEALTQREACTLRKKLLHGEDLWRWKFWLWPQFLMFYHHFVQKPCVWHVRSQFKHILHQFLPFHLHFVRRLHLQVQTCYLTPILRYVHLTWQDHNFTPIFAVRLSFREKGLHLKRLKRQDRNFAQIFNIRVT